MQAIIETVLACGGGLLMVLDADDWIDTRLVAIARATILQGQIGAVIERGYAIDAHGGRALPIPHAAFDRSFDRLRGSSVVARLDASSHDPRHRDPYAVLHEHYRFADLAREHGALCRRLDVDGAYVINTSANHSEMHGPYAAWRRSFNEGIARDGLPADDHFLPRFGLDRAAIQKCFDGEMSVLSPP